jgi:hypothetical protein
VAVGRLPVAAAACSWVVLVTSVLEGGVEGIEALVKGMELTWGQVAAC